ncbi:hypothetical protein PIB30_029156 [Stylosanthes scabra]|uniref:Replication protein A 70 kDa DNA-binding subunit B/D first OB fold domain-containing protein n=1 Tax=Stylosanthes scabra TaxID=79078 RepID=A0ABU6YBA7_9FABA|nr:hypothetical protein [Stylosanthes scabra]
MSNVGRKSSSSSVHKVVDRDAAVHGKTFQWNLVVRVVRMYEATTQRSPSEVYQVELVLQDESGDRIHFTIPKTHLSMYKSVFREFSMYRINNVVVQANVKVPRTTSHNHKLSAYRKPTVESLPSCNFLLNPFHFVSYGDVEGLVTGGNSYLIDCIGHVVGKEDPKDMTTKSGHKTTCMNLYIEDLE